MTDLRMRISFDDDTTAQMRDVLAGIDDATLDNLEVEWEPESPGLTGEPITASVLVTGTAIAIGALLRVIERQMEHQHQMAMMRIVAEGFDKHPKLAEQLKELAKDNNKVSIKYGLAKEPRLPRSH